MTGYAENSLVRGLSFLAEKQAAIANNLANVNTTSFKRRMAVAADSGDDDATPTAATTTTTRDHNVTTT